MFNGLDLMIKEYLDGQKTISDLSAWLASVNWDEGNLDAQSEEILGSLELLITEVKEGLRSESELRERASAIIEPSTTIVSVNTSTYNSPFWGDENILQPSMTKYSYL